MWGLAEMDSAAAGIHFENRVPVSLMMQNQNVLLGSGVAAADFDSDGWCDLYFCAMNGTNALYRNLGHWQFEDVTARAGVGCAELHSTGAVFADVNGDGRPDLLVATLGNGVRCFIQEEGGRFRDATTEAGLLSHSGSTSLALADVNGDGALDLYVANYGAESVLRAGGQAQMKQVGGKFVVTGPYANRLRFVNGQLEELGEADVLYLNDGTGKFRPLPWNSEFFIDEDGRPQAPPLDFGLTVQMRDLDGDGVPDIYVCNDFQSPDRIWINDGRAHFHALPRLAMRKESYSSMSVDFADIDRDGFLDFFVSEMLARKHTDRLRQMPSLQPLLPEPGIIELRPDVARNTLFRNRHDGTYAEIANFARVSASDWSWSAIFLDVDLDGYEDLLIGNGHAYDVLDRDAMERIRTLGKQTLAESRRNLLQYPPLLTPNVLFRNRGDLTFEEVGRAWGFDSTRISHGMALADLDNDGDLDVIVNCWNAPPLLYRNNASRPRVAVRLRGQPPNRAGIGAQIRVTGGPVPVQIQEMISGGRYLSGDDSVRVFAAGTLSNRLAIEVRWRSGKTSRVREAFPNREYRIEEPEGPPASGPKKTARSLETPASRPLFSDISSKLRHHHHDERFDDYARQPLLMKQLSQLGPAVAWIDLDEDGIDELIIGTGRGGETSAYRWQNQQFEKIPSARRFAAPDDTAGFAAMAGAGGRPALLAGLTHYESTNSALPLAIACAIDPGTGQWVVEPMPGPAISCSPGPLAIADMDGDGNLDLFVGGRVIPGEYPRPASSLLFRQQNGTFLPDRENNRLLEHIGLVSGAVWSDLDNDGFPELILACEWGPIRVFKNSAGKLVEVTERLGLNRFWGLWNSVTTGDFDGDGRLDIIAGNWGLNTGYEATPGQPLQIFFPNSAQPQDGTLIEACYAPDQNAMVPLRSLTALSQAFPQLRERFPTHRSFATATITDVLNASNFPHQTVAANTLASMLFLNRTDHFEAVPLPKEAQWAPVFSINVADFNGDGREDVFLGQNFSQMRPEWERLDAGRGLLLLGDGQGHFQPVEADLSGITVYGDQRGAAAGDFNRDGRVDLAVSQNGAATRLFENVGATPGLRVRLKGPPGNPMGIGAVLQSKSAAGLGPARELHSGSGYWSQDSLVQVISTISRPGHLLIHWPGGRLTSTEVPPNARELTIRADGTVEIRKGSP